MFRSLHGAVTQHGFSGRRGSQLQYLSVAAGAAIVGLVLWEVFHDLFHPAGRAALTAAVGRAYFAMLRGKRYRLSLAGPLVLVTVILLWVAGLVAGFALIYLPFFPDGFRTSAGVIPPAVNPVMTTLYISAETLTTLGYGDLPPHDVGLRVIATMEGLVGFALVTASVSEIVLIYPALTRMRHLALGVSHVVRGEAYSGVRLADTGSDVILSGLASGVTHARIDLIHFPVIYFFAPQSEDASIARWTRALARFAGEAGASDRPAHVRFAAATLDKSLDDLSSLLENQFLKSAKGRPRNEIFAAFARYHDVDRPAE
ncbi:MAG: potassium channel family protein [Gemmatimonadaceae bacterium]